MASGCILVYLAAFALIHYTSGLRRPAMDGDWYYSDIASLDSAAFIVFWPLRQINYRINQSQARHISESLPIGLLDGLPTIE